MFIVIPYITEDPVIFGVYSVCISTAIFLSYADLGFVSAGIKYAGEAYARGEHKDEIKLFGFTGFVLFVFVLIIAGIFVVFSQNPNMLIKGINNPVHVEIASRILSTNEENWNTIPRTYSEIDTLRNKFKDDKEKLKALDDINLYIEEMEKIYQKKI